jgi:hypothetical protein
VVYPLPKPFDVRHAPCPAPAAGRSRAACEDLPEFSVRKCATLRITEDFAG